MLGINEGQFDNMPIGCDLDNLIGDLPDDYSIQDIENDLDFIY